MTIRTNIDPRYLREEFEQFTTAVQTGDTGAIAERAIVAVNQAFSAIQEQFLAQGFRVDQSDRAEELIGVLWGFLVDSQAGDVVERFIALAAPASGG